MIHKEQFRVVDNMEFKLQGICLRPTQKLWGLLNFTLLIIRLAACEIYVGYFAIIRIMQSRAVNAEPSIKSLE